MEKIRKFNFEIEGTAPILMHKFNGQKEEKRISELSDNDQAEKHAYRNTNGNLAIPNTWVRGCLINEYISKAGNKQKTKTKLFVSPRIQVEPIMLDLGIAEYEIDVRSVPAGNISRGGTRAICVRPLVNEWAISGILITTLSDAEKDLRKRFEDSGVNVGIGSNRVNGFGRFKVNNFKLSQAESS